MATKLFLRSATSDRGTGNNDANLRGSPFLWNNLLLSTTAGAATVTNGANTVAGPTAGVEVAPGSTTVALVWISPPLDVAVTVSGSITWNIWGRESLAAANVAINGQIERIDGATGAITLIDATARTIELAVSASVNSVNNFAETPAAGVACKRGDRLRVRIYGDDAGTMASAQSFTIGYDGPTAAADGDTWVQLTENLIFASEPAGTQVFLTEVASAVSTASTDLEAWTARGGGVQTAITNTATGYTAPIQMTGTAGGTVVDWFTRPLTAFTLGGAVRVNARVSGTAGGNATPQCEVAVVAGDGTNPTVWGATTFPTATGTTEAARSFLLSGDNLAITAGQRLRVRLYIDDRQDFAMVSGGTYTLYYAGASGATGDTFLTFTQALTELIVPPGPHVSPYPQILAH